MNTVAASSEAYVDGFFNLDHRGVRQTRGTSTAEVPATTCLVTAGEGVPHFGLGARKRRRDMRKSRC